MDIFANRLKWIREKRGMTQKQVAEYMGVSQQYYGRFEKGQGQPNLEALLKLRELFDESLEFLLGYYNLDKEGNMLLSFLRIKKRVIDKKEERLKEFFDFIKNEDINDEQLKDRISKILLSNRKGGSEKGNYLKAKQHFIDYVKTIPGIEEVDDEHVERFIEGFNEFYQRKGHEETMFFVNLTKELFHEYEDEE